MQVWCLILSIWWDWESPWKPTSEALYEGLPRLNCDGEVGVWETSFHGRGLHKKERACCAPGNMLTASGLCVQCDQPHQAFVAMALLPPWKTRPSHREPEQTCLPSAAGCLAVATRPASRCSHWGWSWAFDPPASASPSTGTRDRCVSLPVYVVLGTEPNCCRSY